MTAKADSALDRLAVLVGAWTMESPQYPGFAGRARFEWVEGGAYLAMRYEVDAGEVPSSVWMVGADDTADECVVLYSDSRGVRRVYFTKLADREWTIWRDAPGFNQRFTGTLADDDRTITARWETSMDGSTWAKDFDLIYRRVG